MCADRGAAYGALRQRLVYQRWVAPVPQHLIKSDHSIFFGLQGRALRGEQAMDGKIDRCDGPALPDGVQYYGSIPADFFPATPQKSS